MLVSGLLSVLRISQVSTFSLFMWFALSTVGAILFYHHLKVCFVFFLQFYFLFIWWLKRDCVSRVKTKNDLNIKSSIFILTQQTGWRVQKDNIKKRKIIWMRWCRRLSRIVILLWRHIFFLYTRRAKGKLDYVILY